MTSCADNNVDISLETRYGGMQWKRFNADAQNETTLFLSLNLYICSKIAEHAAQTHTHDPEHELIVTFYTNAIK